MREDIMVVTGYVPIVGHPRTPPEYDALAEAMFGKVVAAPVHPFFETLPETWMMKFLKSQSFTVNPSVADNPKKNTVAYHCVQHQKFGWLLKAALLHPLVKTFVWLDLGIGHVPGVTPDVVNEFLAKVQLNDFAIPGCLSPEEASQNYNYLWPSWRYCGGLMVVPGDRVHDFYKKIKTQVDKHVRGTKNVTWEVNTLFRAERFIQPPIRWYKADHNETMFTNYGDGLCPKQ